MQAHVCDQFDSLPWKDSVDEYNYSHFKTKQVMDDARHTLAADGVRPGQQAPDFELPLVGGGSVRLHDLRGKPALIRFGSFT
jgi:hypothetical protein